MLFEDAVPIPSQSMDAVFDGKGFNEAGKLAVVMMDGWHVVAISTIYKSLNY